MAVKNIRLFWKPVFLGPDPYEVHFIIMANSSDNIQAFQQSQAEGA